MSCRADTRRTLLLYVCSRSQRRSGPFGIVCEKGVALISDKSYASWTVPAGCRLTHHHPFAVRAFKKYILARFAVI